MFIKVSVFACCIMNEPWARCANWNKQSQTTNTAWVHLHEASKVVRFIESESRVVVPRGYEELGKGSSCLMGRVSDFQDTNVLEIWLTTVWICLTLTELKGG